MTYGEGCARCGVGRTTSGRGPRLRQPGEGVVMAILGPVCDEHEHEPDLPDDTLRAHILAAAIRAADARLRAHGWPVDRSAEILHVALEDALDAQREN